jgi:phosphohistidine swiveling domain-containing protein
VVHLIIECAGFLKIINKIENYDKIKKDDVVLVKCKTDISLIKKISLINALIINGGILSHMVVIAREFNIPCLVEPEIVNGKVERYVNKKIIVDAIKGKILTS